MASLSKRQPISQPRQYIHKQQTSRREQAYKRAKVSFQVPNTERDTREEKKYKKNGMKINALFVWAGLAYKS